MVKIVGVPSERTKKFNIFGVDFSVAYAKLWQTHKLVPVTKFSWVTYTKNIFYHRDSEQKHGTLTYRLILWRLKVEIKFLVAEDTFYIGAVA